MNSWKSFDDIKKLNILFLKKKISSTPYSVSIDEETYPMLKTLIKINKKGILTFDSQPNINNCLYKQKSDIWFVADKKEIKHIYNFILPYKKYGIFAPSFPKYSKVNFTNPTAIIKKDNKWIYQYDYSKDIIITTNDIFPGLGNKFICIIFKNVYTGKNVDKILYKAIKNL
jgi:hypothetical protein